MVDTDNLQLGGQRNHLNWCQLHLTVEAMTSGGFRGT